MQQVTLGTVPLCILYTPISIPDTGKREYVVTVMYIRLGADCSLGIPSRGCCTVSLWCMDYGLCTCGCAYPQTSDQEVQFLRL